MPTATCFATSTLIALSLVGAPARAQAVPQGSASERVDSGAVLRVTTRDGAILKGPLVNWSAVGVTLSGRDGDGASPTSFRLADLKAVEVRSVSRRTWRGAVIGLASGVVVGLFGAAIGCSNSYGTKEDYCGLGYVFLPPIFGAVGVVAGAGIGAMTHAESWQAVPLAPQ